LKGIWKLLVPVGILIVPILFLIYLSRGQNVYKTLPHLGMPEGIDEKGDTIFHKVPGFRFTDQDGKPFGSAELKGKTYVADFFFTRCPSICKDLTAALKRVQEEYKEAKNLEFVSFTIDPAHDSAQVLKAYARKYEANERNWHFLRGSKDSVQFLMNQGGYLLLKPEWNEDLAKVNHSELIVLVDRDGHIRGNYNATDKEAVDRLIDEIRVLYHEYAGNTKEKRSNP
jgi:protein SCO1